MSRSEDPARVDDVPRTGPHVLVLVIALPSGETNLSHHTRLRVQAAKRELSLCRISASDRAARTSSTELIGSNSNQGHEWKLSFLCRNASNDLKKTFITYSAYYRHVQSLYSSGVVHTPQYVDVEHHPPYSENSKLSAEGNCRYRP